MEDCYRPATVAFGALRWRIGIIAIMVSLVAFALSPGSAAAISDDNIPGIVATSPYTGSLNLDTDTDDVIKVTVAPGQRIIVTLDGPDSTNTDFDVYLYESPATDIWVDYPVAYGDTPDSLKYSDEVLYYDVTGTTVYIHVSQWEGTGAYTLSWTLVAAPTREPDDDIPGVVASSPATGTLTDSMADEDIDDVYKVYLEAGQTIEARLFGPADADFELYLFGPGAPRVNDYPWLAASRLQSYPESVKYTATESGDYYLDAYVLDGTGEYTLTWDTSSDDEIPGLPRYSPFEGSLSSTDTHDVFKVFLSAEQTLTVSLDGASGTDFALAVFGPDATQVGTDTPVALADAAAYPESLEFVPTTAGFHYIDVRLNRSEPGTYTVAWEADKEAPIAVCEPSSSYEDEAEFVVSATDTGGSEVRDISYALSSDGQNWDATHTAEGTSTVVYVSDPGSWQIRVLARDGAGNLSALTPGNFTVWGTTSLTLSKSTANPAYGAAVTLSATLKRTLTGEKLAGKTVLFEYQYGTTWRPVGSAVTDAYGVARKATVPFRNGKTVYRARFVEASPWRASTATAVTVVPKAYLTTPVAPYSVYRGRAFTAYGFLKPLHTANTYPVRIYKYRVVSGKLVPYGFTNAKAYNYGGYTKYIASLSFPYAGTWKIKAYHGDTLHDVTTTGYDTVYVK